MAPPTDCTPGHAAPDFRLPDTSDAARTLSALRGKTVVLLYEDQTSSAQNEALKRELAARAKQPGVAERVAALPVANLGSFQGMAAFMARTMVKGVARQQGLEILIDADGSVGRRYGFAPGTSCVVVVNPAGRIAFRQDGPMSADDRAAFFRAVEAAATG